MRKLQTNLDCETFYLGLFKNVIVKKKIKVVELFQTKGDQRGMSGKCNMKILDWI